MAIIENIVTEGLDPLILGVLAAELAADQDYFLLGEGRLYHFGDRFEVVVDVLNKSIPVRR